MAANPEPSDLRFAGLVRRVRTRGTRLVLVGLDRPDSLGVLASLPDLLDREPDIELVAFGRLAAHGAAHPLALHDRAVVVRNVPASELLGLITASTVLVSDDPELVAEAPGLGTPAVLVDGPHIPQPGDSIRSILSPAVMDTVRQVLAAARAGPGTVGRAGGACGSSRRWRGCSGSRRRRSWTPRTRRTRRQPRQAPH
jgi:UDP-N-acetylglucosamine 2-epimerase (non-hydrolysing)